MPFHLRSRGAKDQTPLLRRTKQLYIPVTRYIGSECQENHNGLNKEAGQTEDKADPKCGLAKPTCPHRGPANEHQGAQEAELERQEKQETDL